MGILYAYDQPYSADRLWNQFSADKCPTLAGKPKLFFIQACQGSKTDSGTEVQIDSSDSIKIPNHADFLIGYSTIPGFLSWRNSNTGSWFIQSLCDVLRSEGHSLDLLSIMTK